MHQAMCHPPTSSIGGIRIIRSARWLQSIHLSAAETLATLRVATERRASDYHLAKEVIPQSRDRRCQSA